MPDNLRLDDGRLFPVQCFFNAIADFHFVETIGRLLRGIGAGVHDAHCQFSTDLDPCEEEFVGVRFSLFEESTVISVGELHNHIRAACDSYFARHPDEEIAARKALGLEAK